MTDLFNCPVCKQQLTDYGKLYRCTNNHCFDKSKFGYVNLLQSQKSSAKRHGDDRLMVRARKDFLSKGYYSFLCQRLAEICTELLPDSSVILDAGCGECYYSAGIRDYAIEQNKCFVFAGIDISKDALEYASKRKSGVTTAVASVFDLPMPDESCDAVLNVFSPEAFDEFARVLKKDGYLFRVIPLENHLIELKEKIYEKAYLNEVAGEMINGFSLIKEEKLCQKIELTESEDIINLFKMTPYYYKTGIEDQQKLFDIDYLSIRAEFKIRIYRKDFHNA